MLVFDTILSKLGLGKYQILVFLAFCYYNISFGFNGLATVFIAYEPDYRCNVSPLDDKSEYPNLTEADILNFTTPHEDDSQEKYNGCYRYGYNLSTCQLDTSCVNTSSQPIVCDQGYYYDRSLFSETVITEFDMICSNRYLNSLSTSMYYLGMLIGSFIFGNISDAIGRKSTCVITYALTLACMFGLSFIHSVEMYIVLRMGIAAFGYGTSIATFVYTMEVVTGKWRTLFGFSYQATFTVGYMIMGGVAYHWRDWHEIMLISTIIVAPFLLIALIIPESPRWLLNKNKLEKGKQVVKVMERLNGVKLDDSIWKEACQAENTEKMENAKAHSSIDLFKTKGIMIITLKTMFNWFVNSLVYYGVSLNAGALAGDLFVNNTLNGVFEIAAYVFCIVVMDKIGRRLLLSSLMLVAAVGLLASVVVNVYAGENQTLTTLGVVFAFIAKFGISGSFGVIYNLTTELYPTVVRSNGVGLGSLAARIGGIAAPYFISLQDYAEWLPNTIFGVLGLIAGVLALRFPETNGHCMMETIPEAEEFYLNANTKDKRIKNTLERSSGQTNEAFERNPVASAEHAF